MRLYVCVGLSVCALKRKFSGLQRDSGKKPYEFECWLEFVYKQKPLTNVSLATFAYESPTSTEISFEFATASYRSVIFINNIIVTIIMNAIPKLKRLAANAAKNIIFYNSTYR